MIPIKVYAVTLYIDETAAVRELQGLGSIPRPAPNPDDLADALLNGQFRKVLFIELVRTITGQQFVDGLEETLLPRLRGKCAHELAQLKAVLAKHSMMLGSVFLVSVDGGESISFSVLEPGSTHFRSEPVLAVQNALFARAMVDVYLGREPLLPEAKSIWAESAAQLLLRAS